jgi:hypothetical protein
MEADWVLALVIGIDAGQRRAHLINPDFGAEFTLY